VAAAAANAAGANQDDAAARYSSLLDIGQAYGIWNPTEDNSNDNDNDDQKDLKIVEDDEETASSDKETEELKSDLKDKEAGAASTPSGLNSNNNNVTSSDKSLPAARVVPMETA